MGVQISPSVLSADFARLADEAQAVADVADWLHVDVMDNHFVPNLTIGLPVVESLLKHTSLPLDCQLLVMTVEPGFGGQPFLDVVLPKVRRARELIAGHGASVWLQVDGGISEETIERCAMAGADVFVAGSAVYASDDPVSVVRGLRGQAERATAQASWPR